MASKLMYALTVACAATAASALPIPAPGGHDAAASMMEPARRQAQADANSGAPSLLSAGAAPAPSLVNAGAGPATDAQTPMDQPVQPVANVTSAVAAAAAVPKIAPASIVNPVNPGQVMNDLITGAATSLYQGNPTEIMKAIFKTLTSLFGLSTSASGPDAFKAWQQSVDQKLKDIGSNIAQLQKSIDQVLQATTNIAIQQQASELQALLRDMGNAGVIIDNAFLRFTSYAKVLVDLNSPQDQRDDAAKKMYTLLSDGNDPNGRNALVNAIGIYQQKVLGSSDGAQGLLDLIPAVMVKGAWENCAMQLPNKGNSTDVRMASPTGGRVTLAVDSTRVDGPFRDSAAYLWGTCVNQVYTSLQDPTFTARSVERMFASILDKHIKATTLLLNMFPESDTADALVVQQVLSNTELMGQRMATLWGDITAKDFVNPTGAGILNQYGAQLGAKRADSYWYQWAGVQPYFDKLNTHPQPFPGRPDSIQPGMITFACDFRDSFPADYQGLFPRQKSPYFPDTPDSVVYFDACALRTNNIQFDATGEKTQPLPAVVFEADQYYKEERKSTGVLAPFCLCGNDSCDWAGSRQCFEDFGKDWQSAMVYSDFVMDDHDKNGNKCWSGSVPWCMRIDFDKVEYIYANTNAVLPSPFSNLPKSPPQFLQDLMTAYPAPPQTQQ